MQEKWIKFDKKYIANNFTLYGHTAELDYEW